MTKVLLVEDDNNLREIYQARLTAEGYEIFTAKDGEEALVVAKEQRPNLIISDVMMPKISGFEMLDLLKSNTGLSDTKIIMLTALGQAEDQKKANSLGADRYLVKSQVTLEDIVREAKELLEQKTADFPLPNSQNTNQANTVGQDVTVPNTSDQINNPLPTSQPNLNLNSEDNNTLATPPNNDSLIEPNNNQQPTPQEPNLTNFNPSSNEQPLDNSIVSNLTQNPQNYSNSTDNIQTDNSMSQNTQDTVPIPNNLATQEQNSTSIATNPQAPVDHPNSTNSFTQPVNQINDALLNTSQLPTNPAPLSNDTNSTQTNDTTTVDDNNTVLPSDAFNELASSQNDQQTNSTTPSNINPENVVQQSEAITQPSMNNPQLAELDSNNLVKTNSDQPIDNSKAELAAALDQAQSITDEDKTMDASINNFLANSTNDNNDNLADENIILPINPEFDPVNGVQDSSSPITNQPTDPSPMPINNNLSDNATDQNNTAVLEQAMQQLTAASPANPYSLDQPTNNNSSPSTNSSAKRIIQPLDKSNEPSIHELVNQENQQTSTVNMPNLNPPSQANQASSTPNPNQDIDSMAI